MLSDTEASAINRILYVDDEPGMLEIGKLFLEDNRSFQVETALSAIEALDRLDRSIQYDAIVSDFEMPKMNGIAFLKKLRSRGDATPFIIFTGRGREDVVIEALNSGADFYLQKGGDPTAQFAELEHKILRAIAKKRSDLALKKSEQDYRRLIEHAGEAIFVIQNEVFMLINPQASTLSGYTEQELLSKPFIRFVHQDDGASLLDAFQKRSAGHSVPSHYTFRIVRKDGTIRWVELNVVGILWDRRPAILNFMTDITDRKLAEDALKESEERYRQVFRTSIDSLFITSTEGEWIDFNDATVEMFGCRSRDEIIANPIPVFYVNPEDRVAIVRRVENEGYVKEYPLTFKKRDGTHFDATMTVVALRNPDGSTRMFIGTLRDITEHKRTEDALRESEERYRQFFRTTLDGLFITTLDGRWIDFNDATREMLGYASRGELFGIPLISVYAFPDERARFIERIEREGYVKEYPLQLRKRDGSLIDTLMTVAFRNNAEGSAKTLIGTIRDVSERRQAEAALKESEDRYRLVTQLITDFVWDWDIRNGSVRWFGDIDTLLGYAAGEFSHSFKAWERHLHPDDHDRIMDAIRRSLDSGEPFDEEYRMTACDGTIRYFHDRGMVVAGAEGDRTRMLGAVTDITEKRNIENSLKESEELYRLFFKTSQDSVFIVGTNGRYIDCNDHLFQRLGCSSREEVMTIDTTSTYAHPEEREEFLERVQREGYLKEYPITFRKRDGTDFDTLISIVAQKNPDGTTKAYFGTIRDITERKHAEQALRESEERYRRIFESFEDLYYQTDNNGIITILSPSLRALTGFTQDELVGKPVTDIYVNPEDRRFLLEALEQSGHVRDYELLLRKKDGTQVLASLNASRITGIDGTPAGVSGTLRDISRRKRAEDALRESEGMWHTLVDHALNGILILDADGTILFANNVAARTMDAGESSILMGRNVMEFFAPESQKSAVRDLEADVSGTYNPGVVRYHMVSITGRKFTVEGCGNPISYKGQRAELISFRNINGP